MGSDSDCRKSTGCREAGACAAAGGLCVAPSDAVCRQSLGCAREGLCTAEDGRCLARATRDCAAAEVCAKQGRCVARERSCVPGRLPAAKPPAPTAPPEPEGDLAIELLPSVGVGLTGEHAIIGVFGEIMGGLRWRQYAALHLGLAGGSLGADRHVLLVSAVPQLRPLPTELGADVVIGVPLGYVNYSHKAYEFTGTDAVPITQSENGFHLGALVAVLVKASESMALGPAFQFDRFFASEGSNFFSIALTGRYGQWLAPAER